jgi:hypothetical protein
MIGVDTKGVMLVDVFEISLFIVKSGMTNFDDRFERFARSLLSNNTRPSLSCNSTKVFVWL